MIKSFEFTEKECFQIQVALVEYLTVMMKAGFSRESMPTVVELINRFQS